MKVFIAVKGEQGEHDYEVLRAFARRQDAEAYELADDVIELAVNEGPLEARERHVVAWDLNLDWSPSLTCYRAGFDGRSDSEETLGSIVQAETWDLGTARALFDAKRAEYEAQRDERAAELTSRMGSIDVQVWYEPGDGTAIMLTPLHTTEDRLAVPRDLIADQAGLPRGATLHGKWFTVQTLTHSRVDGFSVCRRPYKEGLAARTPRLAPPFQRVP